MVEIVTTENPVLRETAREVGVSDITNAQMRTLYTNMKTALADEKFGVAIAAPQIGVGLRVFVVSGRVFAAMNKEDYSKERHEDVVFINPQIVRASKKQSVGDEGCLSVPGKYGPRVMRSDKVTISYFDEHAQKHESEATGLLARVFQHEIDHLNGVLYIDHALEVIDVDENLQPI